MSDGQLESISEQTTMREALSVVFERSDGGEKKLQWDDVSDELSAEQWGRLIQNDVLIGTGSGFVFRDPDAVERQLESDEEPRDTDDAADVETESWTWYDKTAGVVTVLLFAGYWHTGVRETVASIDNVVLAPVTDLLPFYAVIILLAIATGVYSTVLQSRLKDTEKMEVYREQMQQLKERKKAAEERDDEEALQQIQEEQAKAAGAQLGMLKLQFRPLVWIMLLTIPVFLWLRWKVRGGHLGIDETGLVVPFAGAVSWQESLLGPMSTWIIWYFVCSVVARQILQKTFNLGQSSFSSP